MDAPPQRASQWGRIVTTSRRHATSEAIHPNTQDNLCLPSLNPQQHVPQTRRLAESLVHPSSITDANTWQREAIRVGCDPAEIDSSRIRIASVHYFIPDAFIPEAARVCETLDLMPSPLFQILLGSRHLRMQDNVRAFGEVPLCQNE